MIRIEVAGIDAVEKHLLELPQKVERAVLGKMADFIFNKAYEGADRHTKSGALIHSLYNRPIPGGREIGHDPRIAPHAIFVHWGTRPHVIRPRNKKVLRFQPGGGPFVFARKVQHPGYKGDAWLATAAAEAIRRFDEIVTAA